MLLFCRYIRKWHTVDFPEDLAVSSLGDRDESARVAKGKKDFKPYFDLRPSDPSTNH